MVYQYLQHATIPSDLSALTKERAIPQTAGTHGLEEIHEYLELSYPELVR